MPQVTISRQNGIYHTDIDRKVINNVDTVDWKEMYFRGEVKDEVFEILMHGTLEDHDRQAQLILKDNS